MPDKPLYIYGAGGLGREVLAMVRSLKGWRPEGFIDDGVPKGSRVAGLPVAGGMEIFQGFKKQVNVVLAVGDPIVRYKIAREINSPGVLFPVLIHPSVILQDPDSISLGEGTIITAGSVLTTNINIGKHVLINLNTTVGHDTHIGSYSCIMPGVNIAGEVIIGDCVLIGSGANIMNRMVVSDRSRVGMGAVVTRPVAPGDTVVGVPAKVVNK